MYETRFWIFVRFLSLRGKNHSVMRHRGVKSCNSLNREILFYRTWLITCRSTCLMQCGSSGESRYSMCRMHIFCRSESSNFRLTGLKMILTEVTFDIGKNRGTFLIESISTKYPSNPHVHRRASLRNVLKDEQVIQEISVWLRCSISTANDIHQPNNSIVTWCPLQRWLQFTGKMSEDIDLILPSARRETAETLRLNLQRHASLLEFILRVNLYLHEACVEDTERFQSFQISELNLSHWRIRRSLRFCERIIPNEF